MLGQITGKGKVVDSTQDVPRAESCSESVMLGKGRFGL